VIRSQRVRVLCVDDNEFVLDSVKHLAAQTPDLEVIGTLRSADTLETAVRDLDPDVVLLDLEMPGMDALASLRRVSGAHPRVRVVVLTGTADAASLERSLDAGAFGFVSKADGPRDILDAVRGAAAGRPVFSPEARRMWELAGACAPARPPVAAVDPPGADGTPPPRA